MTCRICGNADGNRAFSAREMMFGTREEFAYFQCASCGCLQIAEAPPDLSRHYPSDYTSFKPGLEHRFANRFRRFFRLRRYRFAVLNEGILGGILHALAPKPKLRMLSLAPLRRDSRFLDVGCGTGELLYTLREIGMTRLLGVDAFVPTGRDIEYPNGLKILKGTLADVTGEWDCVMMSCSLEHMPDQLGTLRAVAALLAPAGVCLVRIPLVSSWAWEHYGVNWGSLDAPRHLYLHSARSIALAAERTGFRIERTIYESDDFQFRVSELYLRDVPLESPQARRVFSRAQVRAWRRRAEALNREGTGDLATFYLRKK